MTQPLRLCATAVHRIETRATGLACQKRLSRQRYCSVLCHHSDVKNCQVSVPSFNSYLTWIAKKLSTLLSSFSSLPILHSLTAHCDEHSYFESGLPGLPSSAPQECVKPSPSPPAPAPTLTAVPPSRPVADRPAEAAQVLSLTRGSWPKLVGERWITG